jgi:serine/threonine-protein kinase
MPRPAHLEVGQIFAEHYRVERALSAGGMGAVYQVVDARTDRRRALKVMLPELARMADARERFRKEARVGASIESEHVVEVLDAGVDSASEMPFLVMELLEGEDLADMVGRRGELAPTAVAAIFVELGHALGAAHRAGVVHRDLKPENLFLARSRRSGGEPTLKILDFGIAKIIAEAHTGSATQSIGSPMWMAPEQTVAGSRISPATDIWALGLIAFFLLSGRPYWRAANSPTREPVMLLREVAFEPIVPASERAAELGVGHLLPPGFDAWFARAVEREPAGRFASVAEQVAELLPLLGGEAPRAREGALHLASAAHADAAVATSAFAPHLVDGAAPTARLPAPRDERDTPAEQPARTVLREPQRVSTTRATALSVTASKPVGKRVAVGAAVVLVLAVAAVVLLRAAPGAPPASAPDGAAMPVVAGSAAALVSPDTGLAALELYSAPHSAESGSLSADSFWLGAAKDFEEAAAQPGAPVRWGAAAQFCRGQALFIGGKLEAAKEAYRGAIAVDRHWAVPHVGLALVLSSLGEVDAALEAAVEAQRLDRNWYKPLWAAASVYARAGKLEQALEEHRRALQKVPGDAWLLANVALGCHAVRLDSEAERYAREALAKNPDLVAARVLLAERALEDNNGKAALDEATRAASVAPRYAPAHLARGDALVLLGNRDEALRAYERAIALVDDSNAIGTNTGRIKVVREALAQNRLPPPRAAAAAPAGNQRTRDLPRTHSAPSPPVPDRTSCSPYDPMCTNF